MFEYQIAEPQNFSDLVQIMIGMDWNEYVENDDTGKLRAVVIGNMCGGKYELYEEQEFLGCTHSVFEAARFVAEGWEVCEIKNKWVITDVKNDEPIFIYNGSFMDAMDFVNRYYEDGTIDIESYENWLNRQ